ncbi:hypothetical protein J5N97_008040 [Dioscorea zingiberensis]|uniref:Uncharacterized protein n=1 Tax=Dioscorea zingiberensis TaxID=325984 RepID=A0A9D5DDU6_9LILI|nr:hypothetical protein J5N97_008040 [Dioscorea zingiberensis]
MSYRTSYKARGFFEIGRKRGTLESRPLNLPPDRLSAVGRRSKPSRRRRPSGPSPALILVFCLKVLNFVLYRIVYQMASPPEILGIEPLTFILYMNFLHDHLCSSVFLRIRANLCVWRANGREEEEK